jgi:polyribonucleotide 5'-hydroxyl-kinase
LGHHNQNSAISASLQNNNHQKRQLSDMALPGLSLPGLGIQPKATPVASGIAPVPTEQPPRKEDLPPQTEWRYEAAFGRPYTVKLLSGHAELFGIELAPGQTYNLSGSQGAIFTWQGCKLEITGESEGEYLAQETDYAVEWLNVHGMLETARDEAQEAGGPRVLVVGPDHAGKSSLVRSLAAWAVKVGRTPTVVNFDPREGLLAPPSSITSVTVGSQLEIESGYGISGISGPTITPVKTPLIYHYPYSSPSERPDVYKTVVTRAALIVSNKLEEDAEAKRSGIIIDTPGSLNDPKSNYDLINHLISEFSISVVLSVGSERLYNDLNRRCSLNKSADEAVPVLRLLKPGGAVERDAAYLKQIRTSQIRRYFFGNSKESLNPHSHSLGFAELDIYRAKASSGDAAASSYRGGDDDDDYDPADVGTSANTVLEKVVPSLAMTGALLAVKFCSGKSDEEAIRDSAVMGYAYVADVDETRKKVRFLAPHPQRWGDRALVWGSWPEVVVDLVT